jgi:hypothetical protein
MQLGESYDEVTFETVVRYCPWQAIYHCTECEHIMSFNEKMDSYGNCPYCGVVTGTLVCRTYKTAKRKVYTYVPPRWKFWKKVRWHWEYSQ